MAFYAKDASSEREKAISQSQHPEVVKAVFAEIDKQGVETKKTLDTINRNYEEVKKLVEEVKSLDILTSDKIDPLLKEQISKYTVDIANRQAEVDTFFAEAKTKREEIGKRMDDLEKAFRRPGGAGDMTAEDFRKLEKAAFDWHIAVLSGHEEGAKWNRTREMKPDIDAYKNYCNSFITLMRSKGEHPEVSMGADMWKSLSVGADVEGGYTVTPAMNSRIITRIFESDPVRELCQVETISTGAMEWLVDFLESGYGWEGETETGAETGTPDLKKKRIPVHVMYAKPRATQVLLEDSGINIENWLADHVARRFARAEGAAFVSGDGIARPRGFLTYSNVDTAGTPQWGRVEQVNMGNASALTADGFKDVKYSLTEYYLNRGTWLMNRTTVSEAMQLKNGQGDYIWRPGMELGQPGMIDGLPVRMSTSMPVVAAGALSVALADWMEFYMVVDRLGITVQRDPFTAKPFIEFYTRKRVGGDVVNFEAGRIGVIAA
jgi:HK97 family phage major capsid protein